MYPQHRNKRCGCWPNRTFASATGMLLLRSVLFQAEDGIRDLTVTGVQTCALPILQAKAAPTDSFVHAPGSERPQGPLCFGIDSAEFQTPRIREFLAVDGQSEAEGGRRSLSFDWLLSSQQKE